MNIYAKMSYLSAFIAFILGFFVYFKAPKKRVNQLFLLMFELTFVWLFACGTLGCVTTKSAGLLWDKIYYTAVPITMFSALLFIFVAMEWHISVKAIITGYSMAAIIIIFNWIPFLRHFLFLDVTRTRHPYKWVAVVGMGYYIVFIYVLACCAILVYVLFKSYQQSAGQKKQKIKYLMVSMMMLGTTAISCYLSVFKMLIIPGVEKGMILVSEFMMAYAIIKYKVMEIDTVIHRTILWFVTLLLVILPIGLLVTVSLDWIIALSRPAKLVLTSAVLVFFVWYYTKLKPYIDHFFRRRKYDYYRVLSEVGQKIGSELDINNVISRLFKELKDVLYIRNGIVLVQQPGQVDYAEAGAIGYEKLSEIAKKENISLACQSKLGQWLSRYKMVLEREQVEVDPQYEPIKEEALFFFNQSSLEVFIPVIMENKVNALVGIGKKESLQAYTIKDVELLENMGRQIGITIDNALHHEDIVEKERLAEEMRLGREIQMNLLPRRIPSISGLSLQGLMQPAKEIGGDYYDFITLPDPDKLSIVIGDVSGKGVAAGLLMAMAKTAIHTLSQEQISPRQVLLSTNKILNQHIGGQKFMTLLYFMWNSQDHTFTYSSAGHEHILVYRKQVQEVQIIQSGGFMLGMIPEIESFLEERKIKLEGGDKILLYTDGVTEAQNSADERFGLERLKNALHKHSQKPALELMEAVKDEVYAFIGDWPQYDDITLVVMEAK